MRYRLSLLVLLSAVFSLFIGPAFAHFPPEHDKCLSVFTEKWDMDACSSKGRNYGSYQVTISNSCPKSLYVGYSFDPKDASHAASIEYFPKRRKYVKGHFGKDGYGFFYTLCMKRLVAPASSVEFSYCGSYTSSGGECVESERPASDGLLDIDEYTDRVSRPRYVPPSPVYIPPPITFEGYTSPRTSPGRSEDFSYDCYTC